MRHVAPTFLEGTLRRGKALEQFLGASPVSFVAALRWLEVRPKNGQFQLWLHEVEDVGSESWVDIYAFPYVQGEPPDGPKASFANPTEAIEFARVEFGADSMRWVNELVVQDEYADFKRANAVASGT